MGQFHINMPGSIELEIEVDDTPVKVNIKFANGKKAKLHFKGKQPDGKKPVKLDLEPGVTRTIVSAGNWLNPATGNKLDRIQLSTSSADMVELIDPTDTSMP